LLLVGGGVMFWFAKDWAVTVICCGASYSHIQGTVAAVGREGDDEALRSEGEGQGKAS